MENNKQAVLNSGCCFIKFFKKRSLRKDFVQHTLSARALGLLLNLFGNERWKQQRKPSVLQTCLHLASRKIMQLTSLDLSLAGLFLGLTLQSKITSELSRSASPDTIIIEHISLKQECLDSMAGSNTTEGYGHPREPKGHILIRLDFLRYC